MQKFASFIASFQGTGSQYVLKLFSYKEARCAKLLSRCAVPHLAEHVLKQSVIFFVTPRLVALFSLFPWAIIVSDLFFLLLHATSHGYAVRPWIKLSKDIKPNFFASCCFCTQLFIGSSWTLKLGLKNMRPQKCSGPSICYQSIHLVECASAVWTILYFSPMLATGCTNYLGKCTHNY